MKYKYVLLDADGTFLDFNKAEAQALRWTFEQAGLEATGDILQSYNKINKQMWEKLERGEITRSELRVRRFELLGEIYPKAGAFMAQSYIENLSKSCFFLTGGEQFLHDVCRECEVAVVTNGITVVQEGRLEIIDIKKYTKHVVISEQYNTSKPDPALAYAALDMLGCKNKKEALIIGDSVSADIELGINAGIDTCLLFGSSDKATYCAESYAQALEILKSV